MRSIGAVKSPRRVSLFSGHYGSGKTNIAVNYALALRERGREVTIADLDIVNPYFRTKDSAEASTNRFIFTVFPSPSASSPTSSDT